MGSIVVLERGVGFDRTVNCCAFALVVVVLDAHSSVPNTS
jgi:hypothetical protein